MKLQKLVFILCLLVAIAASIKSFREPDLWWQIRTGEWILEHHEVPKQDVFSYTMNGTEWINIKWGFEVLAALVTKIAGPESVFFIQSIVNCLLVFFLLKLSILLFRKNGIENPPTQSSFLLSGVITFLVLMIGTEYRMIGRPEMFSHLFTILFLVLLEKNRLSPSRQIYIIIPLQLLWANMHEAFGIGIVILAIYTVSAWIDRMFSKDNKSDAIQLSLISIAAIASVVINPNGIDLLTRPFNILNQVYSNKYTTELLDFTAPEWWKKEAYIGMLFSLVSILTMLAMKKNEKSKYTQFQRFVLKINNPYLITVIAFFYLGLTAYRNLIFISLICFPVFHYFVFLGLRRWSNKAKRIEKYAVHASIVLLVLFYVAIVSNKYYKFTNSRDRFGLEVLSINNPTGAADYIQKNNLRNKVCFSDYLTSSYLLWKLQPEFKTYIDLRDLDVFPAAFFNEFLRDVNSVKDFHKLDSIRHFDYAVVFRPQFNALHAYLYNDSVYALKYVDPVAAVYEKTDAFSRDDIFEKCKPVKPGSFATAVNKILNPFYTPYAYSGIETDYIAASYYLNVGRVELAKQRADNLALSAKTRYKAGELMGQIYFRSAMQEANDSARQGLLSLAEESYLQSLRDNNSFAPSFLGLGSVHYAQKNYTGAISDLNKCLALDEDNYDAHLTIAQCYRELISTGTARKDEYRNKLLQHYLKANDLNPGNPMVIANIGFVYFQVNDCERAKEYLSEVAGRQGLGNSDSLAVLNCLRQCGY
ncbi:MAG: hypothetical protein NTV09_10130 [Bacteroidetes bacterium]|nr:hypothetical protein [Bacteroidota bacterium]